MFTGIIKAKGIGEYTTVAAAPFGASPIRSEE